MGCHLVKTEVRQMLERDPGTPVNSLGAGRQLRQAQCRDRLKPEIESQLDMRHLMTTGSVTPLRCIDVVNCYIGSCDRSSDNKALV